MPKTRQPLLDTIQRIRESVLLQIIAITCTILVLMALGILYPSTKLGFGVVIILAVVNPRLRGFGFDFMPFILLLLTYSELRRLADDFGHIELNIVNLIRWEKALFGGVLPGYWMQANLWDQWYTPVLDVLANFFYLSHFITPVILAGLLWWFRRKEYWAFMIGLVVLSFAAFATYLLFPAAPPWWATEHGYLRSTPITLDKFIIDEEVMATGPNPVAAMPSLHIGYPTYLALVATTVWRRRGLPVFLLPVALMLSAAYLGHHYVIDGVVGAAYALIVYGPVYLALRRTQVTLNVFDLWRSVQARSRATQRSVARERDGSRAR